MFSAAVLHAQDRRFSHRLHLKLMPACTSCHAAVTESTMVADNNLPNAAACKKCHADAVVPSPATAAIAKFSHKRHLAMGNVAPIIASSIDKGAYLSKPGDMRRHLNGANQCAACHRGMEESTVVTAASMPQMADCLVCHSKVDPPFSCPTCHAAGQRLKPVNHSPDFLDRHTTGKLDLDKTTCAVCHGRRFTCLGCH